MIAPNIITSITSDSNPKDSNPKQSAPQQQPSALTPPAQPPARLEEVCLDRTYVLLDTNLFVSANPAKLQRLHEYIQHMLDGGYPLYITQDVRKELTPRYSKRFFNSLRKERSFRYAEAFSKFMSRKYLIRGFDEEGHVLPVDGAHYRNSRLDAFIPRSNLSKPDIGQLSFCLSVGNDAAIITSDNAMHKAAKYTGASCFRYKVAQDGSVLVKAYVSQAQKSRAA
ncbi:MAG TPA: hypothetical protein VK158_06750 [Acidobacteriota bacterium]|nr:hypothetical protein [Acidobacteriota bacterium]